MKQIHGMFDGRKGYSRVATKVQCKTKATAHLNTRIGESLFVGSRSCESTSVKIWIAFEVADVVPTGHLLEMVVGTAT